ncbi:tellurite resistance/C4-dicarboxylate transporter family protein [Halorientalis salina]|uniref:tellurite resistance/C4-dicarboxylate transporter family protein n=1 Tax=Halorientalis salina TaxID=2932266 RepID=UPI0010ACCA90|nr:tellurite resistance/C4-dicarboxylate transporter family protein [Halorientalis salina]
MTDSRDEPEPPIATDRSTAARVSDAVELLDPAYFGFVMSTGIVSIAFRELGIDVVAWPLTLLTIGSYVLLLGLFGARLKVFPGRFVADLRDREKHWGTLTCIVATNTVGIQAIIFFEAVQVAAILWLSTVVATPLLLYYLFATEIIGANKADVSERIDGAFLLVIVCLQSLAILGASLSTAVTGYSNGIVLLSMSYFAAGYVLYFVVVTIVIYRLFDGAVRPDDWTGPYWITMGAAAITTLAGATLGPRLTAVTAWEPIAPLLVGVTFLAWAIASWWIPLLLAIDIWKFTTGDIEGRPPVWVLTVPWSRLGFGNRLHTYAPTAWGRVFPMGMYTACTVNLAGISAFKSLALGPVYWGWFALFVWALTLVGTVRASLSVLFRGVRPKPSADESV